MKNIDNDLTDNESNNMIANDAFLSKVVEKHKNKKVPAYKKDPIHCNNVVTNYVEFNESDYVRVYSETGGADNEKT